MATVPTPLPSMVFQDIITDITSNILDLHVTDIRSKSFLIGMIAKLLSPHKDARFSSPCLRSLKICNFSLVLHLSLNCGQSLMTVLKDSHHLGKTLTGNYDSLSLQQNIRHSWQCFSPENLSRWLHVRTYYGGKLWCCFFVFLWRCSRRGVVCLWWWWWCFCFFAVVWWCFCGGVFLWCLVVSCCFCVGCVGVFCAPFCGGVALMYLWWCAVVFLWGCFLG